MCSPCDSGSRSRPRWASDGILAIETTPTDSRGTRTSRHGVWRMLFSASLHCLPLLVTAVSPTFRFVIDLPHEPPATYRSAAFGIFLVCTRFRRCVSLVYAYQPDEVVVDVRACWPKRASTKARCGATQDRAERTGNVEVRQVPKTARTEDLNKRVPAVSHVP